MIAILADDLTGALDSAACFAGRGLHTEVALDPVVIPQVLEDRPDVIAINLACRELDAKQAQAATMSALAALPPGTMLFKKIDSRLKGHIEAELDVTPFLRALVVPAIAEFGRLVEAGHVTGFGVETPISIAGRLGRHAACSIIPDIRSAGDIDTALRSTREDGVDLLIGARGLAEALARQVSGMAQAKPANVPAGPALFVIGSRDPITVEQVENLRDGCPVTYLPAPNGQLLGEPEAGSGVTLVQAVPGRQECSAPEVSQALADSLVPFLTEPARTLLLSGGATAEAILRRMGISRFRLHGECVPGLGLAYSDRHCIITKSGGFGTPQTLKSIANTILQKAG